MPNPLRRAVRQALEEQGYSRARATAIVDAEESLLVSTLLGQLKALGVPEPVLEWRPTKDRKWQVDLAWPYQHIRSGPLCVEVDGGTNDRVRGRHVRQDGFRADCEKLNWLSLAGYRVLRYPAEDIESGAAARQIAEALGMEMTA